ncbi:hypothetical protein LY13_004391 [Prauserella aidingensis]|nr:hypothetical protein [Prauserella aidingensis]MCP2255612.1 hypothetical protein [Prauserella aidingensis]
MQVSDGSGPAPLAPQDAAATGAALAGGNMFAAVNFVVDGKETNPGSGGGYEFDGETAKGIYEEALTLAERYRDHMQAANDLVMYAQPPAEDTASVRFTEVAQRSWQVGAEHVADLWKFHRDLAEKLGRALGVYEEAEDRAGKDVKNAGGRDGNDEGGFVA